MRLPYIVLGWISGKLDYWLRYRLYAVLRITLPYRLRRMWHGRWMLPLIVLYKAAQRRAVKLADRWTLTARPTTPRYHAAWEFLEEYQTAYQLCDGCGHPVHQATPVIDGFDVYHGQCLDDEPQPDDDYDEGFTDPYSWSSADPYPVGEEPDGYGHHEDLEADDQTEFYADQCSRDDHRNCTGGPFTWLGKSGHWYDNEGMAELIRRQLKDGTSPYL